MDYKLEMKGIFELTVMVLINFKVYGSISPKDIYIHLGYGLKIDLSATNWVDSTCLSRIIKLHKDWNIFKLFVKWYLLTLVDP